MNDDSFKNRVDRIFGSLPIPNPPNNNNNTLWSLTDAEIQRQEWIRHKADSPDPDDNFSGPFAPRPDRLSLSNRKRKGLFTAVNDPNNNLIDDEEEEDDGPSSRMCLKPDDCDDEEWSVRTSIGMDCTLDKEEEEDEFDKVAVGREKKGDRIYMNEIVDYTTHADTFYELPTSVEDVGRDPRANHLAAELRLKEDDALAGSEVSRKPSLAVRSSNAHNGLPVEQGSVRSILKKDEKKVEPQSRKRVRFDPETDSNLKKQATGLSEGNQILEQPPQTDSRVPDYLRNPSKYTQYTFDSTNDLEDGEANKKGFMDFLQLVRQKRANEAQSAEHVRETTNTVTFVPRKKSNNDSVEQGDASKRNIHKENVASQSISPVIVAADEACAMEEDEPETNKVPVPSTVPRKAQRQYRARATPEPQEE